MLQLRSIFLRHTRIVNAASLIGVPMSKQDSYILGINAYDHDVSACLLRNGEIAVATSKERITRKKHDSGFFREAVDYCLNAEGITLDDVDLVVRNSYVLPVDDTESMRVSMSSTGRT